MIWHKGYIDQYGREETDRPYQYFQMYLQQEGTRSVKRVYQDLKTAQQKSQKNSQTPPKIPLYDTLQGYCRKFHWVKRASAYDEYQNNFCDSIQIEKKKNSLRISNKLTSICLKEIKASAKRIAYATEALEKAKEAYDQGNIDLGTYIRYMSSLNKTYDQALQTFYSLERDQTDTDTQMVINNNVKTDDTIVKNNNITFHELMNKTDLIKELTDDEYQQVKNTDNR